jgi:hypothetical protein
VISTSLRFSACAAAMPAKPPPTINMRFLPGIGIIVAGSFSSSERFGDYGRAGSLRTDRSIISVTARPEADS